MKVAMITGANGMDGSILADKLLAKGYKVIGLDRWNPTGMSPNLKDAITSPNFVFESGDIREKEFIYRVIKTYQPDYFYNMAAISLVPESFKIPVTVFETNAIAVINMLETIREYSPQTRFYQASTSEMIGENTDHPQNTHSHMLPNSPYAIAKLASYHMVRAYRNGFGLFAVNGMLWNHEGERRGPTFVTRKITMCIARQLNGSDEKLQLGNLDSFRDWGYAPDFCDAMILMLESDVPGDYAVATGESHSIREFVEEAYRNVGINIRWVGIGLSEVGVDDNNRILVEINPKFYRPVEVPYLHGDYTETKQKLGWEPTTRFKELVKLMIISDVECEKNGKND